MRVTSRARDGRLGRVLVACALFGVVEYCYWTVVLLYAFDEGGASLAGLVLLAQLLPAALLAPVLGGLGDRVPRGAALSGTYGAQAACLVVLALLLSGGSPLGVVVLMSALTTIVVSVSRPVHYSALPQLARTPRALVRANALSGLADAIGVFVGPALAGVVAGASGFGPVAAGCAVAMALAALLCLRLELPASEGHTEGGADGGTWAGVTLVARDRPVLVLLLLVGVSFVATGSFEILGVAFADTVLGGSAAASGVMIGAAGIGALIGSAVAAGLAVRSRLAPIAVVSLAASGLPLLLMSLAGALPSAVLLLTLCGIGIALSSVACRTLLQRTTDARLLARVFAVQEAVLLLGLALGAVIGPVLVGWFGAASAYAPMAVALIGIALASWPAVRLLDLRASFRPDVAIALRRVGFLAAMPPPALDRLAQGAEWLDVTAGTVVIRQGDEGDAFFTIADGRMSVTVDGVLREHTLGPGDGFGEIALLLDVPRTATIAAMVDSRLLRVARGDFLAAVTGSADGHAIAHQVAAAHIERDSR
jgi:MFS family permease